MSSTRNELARNAIIGALVADAASMGFHWLYSQSRIQQIAPEHPEFHTPDAADFEGNVGYFAHGHKVAGELSHYGEQALVMLMSLAGNGGRYEKHHYEEQFRGHFGYGGAFHGYIDRPTRETLDNVYRAESDALRNTSSIPFTGDPKQRQVILIKILAAAKRCQGDRLREEATTLANSLPDPEESLAYALALIDALAGSNTFHGAIDEQLPAISKLPALVAVHADSADLSELVSSAVRVTNNTPRAIDFGNVAAAILLACIKGESMAAAIEAGVETASAETAIQLRTALSRDSTLNDVTREFGLHCDLGSGVCSILSNLKTAKSFEEAVVRNIYAGGDNCGRSILLGAVCGATFGLGGQPGIPERWVDRLSKKQEIAGLLDRLF